MSIKTWIGLENSFEGPIPTQLELKPVKEVEGLLDKRPSRLRYDKSQFTNLATEDTDATTLFREIAIPMEFADSEKYVQPVKADECVLIPNTPFDLITALSQGGTVDMIFVDTQGKDENSNQIAVRKSVSGILYDQDSRTFTFEYANTSITHFTPVASSLMPQYSDPYKIEELPAIYIVALENPLETRKNPRNPIEEATSIDDLIDVVNKRPTWVREDDLTKVKTAAEVVQAITRVKKILENPNDTRTVDELVSSITSASGIREQARIILNDTYPQKRQSN